MTKKINYVREFVLTFSSEKSLFSSKKIERCIVFITFLILTVMFLLKNMEKISTENLLEILGLWLTYGGYNSMMGYKDKKLDVTADAAKDGAPVVEGDGAVNVDVNVKK